MKNKFLQYTVLGCTLMFLFSACRKDSFKGTEAKESGKTFVYIEQAQTNNQFFDVFTDVKPITLFTVRRDAASKADLQKSVTVSLKAMDQAYITSKGANYTLLPSSIYTLSTTQSGVSIAANGDLTLNFAGGDYAKNIIFNVDGSKVDLSKQYAVAYVITNFGGFSKQHTASGVSQDTIFATIAIKNKYDGNYDVTGSYSDANIPAATGPYPYNVNLETISANANDIYNNDLGGYGFLFNVGDGTQSYYGSFSPEFTFDPATNKVVSVVNAYGQLSGSHKRSAELDPSGVNAYDPGTKTIQVKYVMISDGVVRCHFDETYTYKGPR
ncbi:DUF1735 domain-containing protein [Mucilaginibacter sp. L3T2-6]|uniref:DUF1735 domain-containing protein n=1 Tax=Mucilaginibacter sp. L3T2-6 TaxID=3062491 RepID=UPI002674FBC9|nr:DUF1735 domain-containing protein [Mucilaginibacter sp. L3T2-6]MDO3642306.1 DUF1735 domain-containing protein [Mucilaginibacter sp. L3T2-6]MDV6214801.1 DUF1735 domain-containing protein [Mucilaginibacter sp. L3T2-6]